MALHATRINDTEVRITRLRKKMENENLDKASFDSLLRKRWLAEHMLEKEKEEDQPRRNSRWAKVDSLCEAEV